MNVIIFEIKIISHLKIYSKLNTNPVYLKTVLRHNCSVPNNFFMSFENSTQAKHWLFSERQLSEMRERVSESISLSIEEEDTLQFYMMQRIARKCDELRFDPQTKGTSIVYLQRYFLKKPLNYLLLDQVLAACIFLASKAEERYYPATVIMNAFKLTETELATAEVMVLSAISFHLLVWKPDQSFRGCLLDLNV